MFHSPAQGPLARHVLMLGAEEIAALADLDSVMQSQAQAFISLAQGSAQAPPRLLLNGPDDSVAFCYASRITAETGPVCKFGSVNPGNAAEGLPSVSALVIALDPRTGEVAALLDGDALTALRTPAASALAMKSLAGPNPRRLAVLGTGLQGQAHVKALCAVLPITEVTLSSPEPASLSAALEVLSRELDIEVRPAVSAELAVREADLVVTATTSLTPVLSATWLAPGTTVLSVGSFAPERRELGEDVLQRADVIVVDDPDAAWQQAGPFVDARRNGAIATDRVAALGDVLLGRHPGRTDAEQIVLYNSVGLGIQDAAVSWMIIERARAAGLVSTPETR
ncbi:MAG: ornithine cyclodeaminase [Blastococcus sp.]|nr:ornithine cyclodeaminase [Blastococcus sp.]